MHNPAACSSFASKIHLGFPNRALLLFRSHSPIQDPINHARRIMLSDGNPQTRTLTPENHLAPNLAMLTGPLGPGLALHLQSTRLCMRCVLPAVPTLDVTIGSAIDSLRQIVTKQSLRCSTLVWKWLRRTKTPTRCHRRMRCDVAARASQVAPPADEFRIATMAPSLLLEEN